MDQMMQITSEKDITPEAAKSLREKAGMTQKEFWENVGSNQSSGHWFENGKRKSIPRPLRILLFLRYVAGIALNVSDPQDASIAVALGRELTAKYEAVRAKREAALARLRAQEAEKKAKSLAA